MKQTLLTELVTFWGLAGFFVSILAALILLSRPNIPRLESRILSFLLFGYAWSLINGVLIHSGYLIEIPWMYRTGSPVHYLLPVSAWLYVRVSLGQELRLKRTDWLLFLPAILHFFELLPLYLMPLENKLMLVGENYESKPENFLRYNEGLLPPYFHSSIKLGAAMVSAAFQWNYYLRWKQHAQKESHKGFNHWVLFFICANTLFYLSVIPSFLGFLSVHWLGLSDLILALFLVITSVVLFFNPAILYGIEDMPTFPVVSTEPDISDAGGKTFELPLELRSAYKARIDELMRREQPFRKHGYSIRQLSDELAIPVHHLSIVFNREYEINFNEFINRQRIAFLLERFDLPDWRKYTLESLAADAGFNARNTFFTVFKKSMGVSPTEYLRLREESAN